MMTRIPGWNARLSAHLQSLDRVPQDWTGNDCLLRLVGGAIEALTGQDVVAPWRGRWTSAIGAGRVMRNDGFDNLGDAVASVLREVHPSRARTGDVAAIPSGDAFGFVLGVVDGPRVHVLTETGRGTVARSRMIRAFMV